MRLSAEQFADLAASFAPEDRARPGKERRRAPRLELSADLTMRVLKDDRLGRAVTAAVQYFSSRGLAVLYPAVTTSVVVITANHYWLDGLVGVLLLATAAAAVTALTPRRRAPVPLPH